VENRLTLKALANVSPGFALKPWVKNAWGDSSQPSENGMHFPGLPKRNPGLELANAFSVIRSAQIGSFNTGPQPTNPLLSKAR
jgi:hypothetical protein